MQFHPIISNSSRWLNVFIAACRPQSAIGYQVDLRTGLFVHSETDFQLEDMVPIKLTRTYRPRDAISRPFGIGTSHSYELFLVGDSSTYSYIELILSDGGRVHYGRISPGTSYPDAVLEHTATASKFYKSQIKWNGQGWDLRLRDGTRYVFPDSKNTARPAQAALIGLHNQHGHSLRLARDATGNLLSISSPNGRWLKFSYDAGNRITQARDSDGREVAYEYDPEGRLTTVRDSSGKVTSYTYDVSHQMRTIRDSNGKVVLTNEYDRLGRVIKQILQDGSTYQFTYTSDNDGKITAADVTDPSGQVRRMRFASKP